MNRCTKYMHLKQPEKQIKVIKLVVTLTQAGWRETVALAHNAINQAFLFYKATGNTMVRSKIVQDSHSLKGAMINARVFRDKNRLNYTYWHSICGLLICVHMYVCSCKDARIKLRPHWFLGMDTEKTISKQLFTEICKLSLLRKTWLGELVSYHFGLPGLINAPTNKWASCYTYMGMDMVVCEPKRTHRPKGEKRRQRFWVWKAVDLYSC